MRLWDTPRSRFLLAFALRTVYAGYAVTIATTNTPFTLAVTPGEVGFLVWSLTLAMEEARQMLAAGLLGYLSDKWNVLDQSSNRDMLTSPLSRLIARV